MNTNAAESHGAIGQGNTNRGREERKGGLGGDWEHLHRWKEKGTGKCTLLCALDDFALGEKFIKNLSFLFRRFQYTIHKLRFNIYIYIYAKFQRELVCKMKDKEMNIKGRVRGIVSDDSPLVLSLKYTYLLTNVYEWFQHSERAKSNWPSSSFHPLKYSD